MYKLSAQTSQLWVTKEEDGILTQRTYEDCNETNNGTKEFDNCELKELDTSCFAMQGVPIPLMSIQKQNLWVNKKDYYNQTDFLTTH